MPLITDAGGIEIFVEELLELVVRRHVVALAAFLVQPQPPALAVGKIVLDLHPNDGADPRKAVDHDADQRAVAQPDERRHLPLESVLGLDGFCHLDAGEQSARLVLAQDRRLAALDDVLGAAHRMRRVDRQHLADDEPVEQHADRRQVLLDGRPRRGALPDRAIAGL